MGVPSRPGQGGNYGCSDYREEMLLMGLRRKLEGGGLSEEERAELEAKAAELEKKMGMD